MNVKKLIIAFLLCTLSAPAYAISEQQAFVDITKGGLPANYNSMPKGERAYLIIKILDSKTLRACTNLAYEEHQRYLAEKVIANHEKNRHHNDAALVDEGLAGERKIVFVSMAKGCRVVERAILAPAIKAWALTENGEG